MAKKKRNNRTRHNEFNSDPFNDLKGFAFSPEKKEVSSSAVKPETEVLPSFSAAMEELGVQRLQREDDIVEEGYDLFLQDSKQDFEPTDPSDEELFLAALGDLSINFQDQYPDQTPSLQATVRRMKQLKLGRMIPGAFLDLHGCRRIEVATKISHFLDNSSHQGHQVVIIITGKGLHSDEGIAVLRDEAEQFLATQCAALISEWGRAPKQYGGNGALAVFLRKQ